LREAAQYQVNPKIAKQEQEWQAAKEAAKKEQQQQAK